MTIPWVVLRRSHVRHHVARRFAPQHLGTERSEDLPLFGGEMSDGAGERVPGDDGIEPRDFRRRVAHVEVRADRALAPGRARGEKERAPSGLSVDHEHGAWLDDAREIEELVALAERRLAAPLGGALDD